LRTRTQAGSSHLASATANSGLQSTAASKKWRRLSFRGSKPGCLFFANTPQIYHILPELLSDGLRYQLLSGPYDPPRTWRGGKLFRDDFFYRLCSDVIHVPPLRQRLAEDPKELRQLVEHLLTGMTGGPGHALAAKIE